MKSLLIFLTLLSSQVFAEGYPVYKMLAETTYVAKTDFGRGTAFAVTFNNKKYMVTNWHVCYSSPGVLVVNEALDIQDIAKVVKSDPITDLCIMSVSNFYEKNLEKIKFLDVSDSFNIKGIIYSMGYPGSRGRIFNKGHYLRSVRFALHYNILDGTCVGTKALDGKCAIKHDLIDTTIPGGSGTSGSAVVNSKGKIIGVVNSSNGSRISMVRLEALKKVLSTL